MKLTSKIVLVTSTCLFSAIANAGVMTLSGTIYDHQMSETDFQPTYQNGVHPGMVSSMLNSEGVPDYIGTQPSHIDGVADADSFANWWKSDQSVDFELDLLESSDGSGEFSYSNSAFFPIDDQLYGNEGLGHNYHFTMHLEGQIAFDEGDSFNFVGDDDLWIYIDGNLVMDLGGVHAPSAGEFSTDTLINDLGLEAGSLYDLDIFFAERHTVMSSFTIETSMKVSSVDVPESPTIVLFSLGLVGLVGARRRRR